MRGGMHFTWTPWKEYRLGCRSVNPRGQQELNGDGDEEGEKDTEQRGEKRRSGASAKGRSGLTADRRDSPIMCFLTTLAMHRMPSLTEIELN